MSNPFIVFTALRVALGEWRDRTHPIIAGHPTWDEGQIAQQAYEEVGVRSPKVILPVFERRNDLRDRPGPALHCKAASQERNRQKPLSFPQIKNAHRCEPP
mgnify:CR=1 FL=1